MKSRRPRASAPGGGQPPKPEPPAAPSETAAPQSGPAPDPAGITRRDFLRDTSFLAAGIAAAAHRPASARETTAPAPRASSSGPAFGKVAAPVRIAIVGGNFGAQFYWHEHPQCQVVAVADLLPERLAFLQETYRCPRGYASLDDLLNDDTLQCDAVSIFTDGTRGVDHAIACLARGKHVVAGSPAAMTLSDATRLRAAVVNSGLTYMLAETSYYQQSVISARKWYEAGEFGTIFSTEAQYHHPGLEKLFVDDAGKPTWRYGLPPMLYSTHCTCPLLSVTGERLVSVSATGWGDDHPILQNNPFKNPFWCETALFKTDRGNTLNAQVYWRGALGIAERAQWFGTKMSFFSAHPNGSQPIIRRTEEATREPAGAGEKRRSIYEKYDQKLWWETDLLPEPLRHISGHEGSHTFLTHEFISALVEGRRPAMDVDLALNLALPGIIAHESALAGGKLLTIHASTDL